MSGRGKAIRKRDARAKRRDRLLAFSTEAAIVFIVGCSIASRICLGCKSEEDGVSTADRTEGRLQGSDSPPLTSSSSGTCSAPRDRPCTRTRSPASSLPCSLSQQIRAERQSDAWSSADLKRDGDSRMTHPIPTRWTAFPPGPVSSSPSTWTRSSSAIMSSPPLTGAAAGVHLR